MGKTEYEAWRMKEYRCDYRRVEECNQMTMKEAVSSIRLHNTHEESIEQLLSVGLDQEESEKLIYDLETEHYVPILEENGKYECPNCGSEVEKGQVECKEESCELEFVWR